MPEWDNDENENETPLIKSLRQQIEKLGKRVTEAEVRTAAAEGTLTERVLSETLTAKGVNPKAARFLVKDGVDATDEKAVAEWLDENSDMFPAATTEATAQPTEGEPEANAELAAGHQNLTGLAAMQRPADMNKFTELDRQLPANATTDQVWDTFTKGGL